MKALYNYRPFRCSKGKNVIADVLTLDKDSSEIRYKSRHNWVSTKKLKPYLDPDADGNQWIFLNYIIVKNDHPKLPAFTIFNEKEQYVSYVHEFKDSRQLIINKILKQ